LPNQKNGFSFQSLKPFLQKGKKVRTSDLDNLSEQIKVDKFWRISKNYQAVKEALMRGPISMQVNGKAKEFLYYKKGIIDSKECTPDLTHAVLGVGYGKDRSG
jgi:hypothetical protein